MKARLLPLFVAIILVVGLVCAETKTASLSTSQTSTAGGVAATTQTVSKESQDSSSKESDAAQDTSSQSDQPSERYSTQHSSTRQIESVRIVESQRTTSKEGFAQQSGSGTISGSSDEVSSAESEAQEFKRVLQIEDLRKPQIKVVQKLLATKSTDEANFNHIVHIAKRTVTRSLEKELLVNELGDMDNRFVAKFSIIASKPVLKTEVSKQVEDYLAAVQNPEVIGIRIDDNKIKEVLLENKDFDTLIAEIW